MPVKIPSAAGKPYRPSNGTEGDLFHARWCAHCPKWEEFSGCDIQMDAMMMPDSEYPDYPREWRYDAQGVPLCSAFTTSNEPVEPRCTSTPDLFGDTP